MVLAVLISTGILLPACLITRSVTQPGVRYKCVYRTRAHLDSVPNQKRHSGSGHVALVGYG